MTDRGPASFGAVILAALKRDPSRGLERFVYHLIALGRHLTVGGVALALLWALLFRPPASADQTRMIVQAIERGAQAQVEATNKTGQKVEYLAERVGDQTTEIARVAGAKGCAPCPSCPDCRCQPCPRAQLTLPSYHPPRSTGREK